jgi:hypothetical protein
MEVLTVIIGAVEGLFDSISSIFVASNETTQSQYDTTNTFLNVIFGFKQANTIDEQTKVAAQRNTMLFVTIIIVTVIIALVLIKRGKK